MYQVQLAYKREKHVLWFKTRFMKWLFIWQAKHNQRLHFKNASGVAASGSSRCFMWTNDIKLLDY